MTDTTQPNTISSWGFDTPRGIMNTLSPAGRNSCFAADGDFVRTRMTIERRTFSFSSSKGGAEIVDVTDMSDVSSYFPRTPVRRILSPSIGRPVEVVDVTDMSVSQNYSTKSPARSGYAMTVATSEVVDICDVSSSYVTDRNKPIDSRYDHYDFREPPESVHVFRDQAPQRLRSQILWHTDNTSTRLPPTSDRAAANNRFRQPSWSSDTPSSVAVQSPIRTFDLVNSSDDAALSTSTAVTTNRYDRYQYLGNGTRERSTNATSNFDLISSARDVALSPRVVDIDRVITKYTKKPAVQSSVRGNYRYGGTRKTSYNGYGLNDWGS